MWGPKAHQRFEISFKPGKNKISKHDGEHDHQILSMSATVMLLLMLKRTKTISPKTDHIFKI